MPTVSFDFTAPHLAILVDALCAGYEYKAEITNPNPDTPGMIPNPETRQQFARRMMKRIFKEIADNYQIQQRDRTAIAAAPAITPIDIT